MNMAIQSNLAMDHKETFHFSDKKALHADGVEYILTTRFLYILPVAVFDGDGHE